MSTSVIGKLVSAIAAISLCVAPALAAKPAPAAKPETKIEPKSGVVLVKIDGGTFHYGCEPKDRRCTDEEKPGTEVKVDSFWLARTKTTVEAYEKCQAAKACPITGHWQKAPDKGTANGPDCNLPGRLQFPMNCVAWVDAKAVCTWIGGRLPTAEEWEHAAKGGEGRIYPWGNSEPTEKRVRMHGRGTDAIDAHPRSASKAGLVQLVGNTAEWTSTLSEDGRRAEVKGSSADSAAYYFRSSRRRPRRTEGDGSWSVGFRCAMDVAGGGGR